jgi:hypothetical protein
LDWCQVEQVPGLDRGVAVIVSPAHIFDLKCAKHLARVAGKSPSWIARDVIDLTVLDLQTARS